MTGFSKAQKGAVKSGRQAVSGLQAGQAQYGADPLVQLIQAMTMGRAANPHTMTPELLAGLNANAASNAGATMKGNLNDMYARLAGVGSGFRGGAARMGEIGAASGMASSLANAERQLSVDASKQNLQDELSTANLAQGFLAPLYQWFQNIANAQLGLGGIYNNLGPTPGQSAFSGLGQLASSTLGAAGAAGGFGNLFGSTPPPTSTG